MGIAGPKRIMLPLDFDKDEYLDMSTQYSSSLILHTQHQEKPYLEELPLLDMA